MRKLHVASSIGIISCKVPHTNNSDLTRVRLNNAMKTYTKCDELTAAVNSIIEIIDWKVLGMKDLADKPRFAAWKEAVSSVVEVVDSVHKIVRITHEIPLTVIVAERFCKWHERVGWENEGHPFPNWRLIMHPDKATFDDHPWLQTVERHFDLQCTGFKTSAFPPAAEPSLETLPKDMSCKGKEKVSDAEVKAMIGDDDGEDELVDEDAEMGGDTVHYEPARGQPSMRQVAASGSRQPAHQSRTPKPKLVKQEEVDELDEEDDEEEDVDMDRPGTSSHPGPQSTGRGRSQPGDGVHPATEPSGLTALPSNNCCDKCTDTNVPCIRKQKGPKEKTPATPSQRNPSHANKDNDADYTTTHPEKKPRTSNTSKCPPESRSQPVVMIPHGRPVIRLPARPAPNPTHISHAVSDQHSLTTTPAPGPSAIATSRGTNPTNSAPIPSVPNPPTAPTPQQQPSSLFEVDVCDELNQLFQFCDTISAQMLEVKTRLNVFDGRRQAATPGLFEERMQTMADDVAEVMSHQKSSEKKVHTVVRQITGEYAALSLRQMASDQRLDSAIRAIEALQLEVVALAAGQLPPADNPTSGLVAPPPPSDDGNNVMAGSGHPGDAEISRMEGDPAGESMAMQEGQFDRGHPGDGELRPGAMQVTAAASTIPNICCEPPPKEYQSRSNVAGWTDGGLQPAEGTVYSYHGRADLADRPVGLEWERQSEDVDAMGRYVQGVFSDTEFPPSQ
ncbi:hypothetical protein BKA82DRAFT_18068 [Pisolithus tinctorius]|uniref:Uncharacterized protein n=1 Tax=Pisolithus tinctorius Marx 270 TaxID=870435 RepID=A0A0C3JXD0_PISTI|nr:hypothetical protein BKA82DRAFT_18068 [Pisolithus tinctorius]KIO13788.1 hypothetical protein M404DRAFT_18068 [Pisolithus tinctorius Marx 270]